MTRSAHIDAANPGLSELDAGSLDRLHDIIIPEAVSLWPSSPGWLLLLLLILSFLLPWFIRRGLQYQANSYRRSALAELQDIRRINAPGQKLKQSLILLKRTALSVYPRQQVASLSSEKWWQFLTQHSGVEFSAATRKLCSEVLYNPALINDMANDMASEMISDKASNIDDEICQLFFQEIKAWIQQHHLANFSDAREDDV